MVFTTHTLLLTAGIYLLLLFAVAFACDRGFLPKRLARHPLTYVLSLCVYTSAWTIYACIGYAYHYGFNFLAFFLGVSGVFLLAPVLLIPLLRLTRSFQLASLADLFAFRYRSRRVGTLTTLLLLIAMLPLMALQLQAVTTSIEVLTHQTEEHHTAFWFCLLILVFTILFGTRDLSHRHKHEGLVVAIAFESLLKIIAFAAVAIIGFFEVFHGPHGFSQWLADHPEMISRMYAPLENGAWHSLIVAFFVAAVVMPHLFHMTFTENLNPNTLASASWALPLLMLIMALCVPFILWEALAGGAPTQPDYHVLGIGMITQPWVTLLGFLAGLASASGMLIVTLLALASMCLNHLVLPLAHPKPLDDLYVRLLWIKRSLIAAILLATYGFHTLTPPSSLMELGSLSFIAALQFVPGLIGLLLWPGANRIGLIAGLLAGFTFWTVTLLEPSLGLQTHAGPMWHFLHLGNSDELQQRYNIGTISLIINAMVLIVVSLITHTSTEERQAAEACALNSTSRSHRWALEATTVDDFEHALAIPLGPVTSKREVRLALSDLALDHTEIRPYALRRLRDQLESNLSGLVGPSVANKLVASYLPYRKDQPDKPEDTQLIEARIEMYRDRLSGLAAELDSLRRFHRQTLLELPMGVISLSDDGEIIGWNRRMEALTGISATEIVGASLEALPAPWAKPLCAFSQQQEDHNPRCPLDTPTPRWVSLHKSLIQGTSANEPSNGLVIVVEDITDHNLMEARLAHNERLASIGRLAAGVAHEIGNPVTAIACLAQNLEYATSTPVSSKTDTDLKEVTQTMQQIMEQTRRISRIVESLVTFSHSGQQHATLLKLPVSIHDTCDEAISLLRLNPDYRDHTFVNQTDASHLVSGDAQRLLQVFVNLLTNAADASEPGDSITISSRREDSNVLIEVEDQGQGIDPSLGEHLFEPFVTSKAPGHGTGLGLALIYSIIEEHEGSISVISPVKEGRGSRFTLCLPPYMETAATTEPL
jgi:PAS domain S-box-containing protein